MKDQISGLQQENEMLVRRNEQLSYINGLAIEFSMDPTIVTLVDRYSREYMRKSGPEWRLVRTPEFMSYIMLSLTMWNPRGTPTPWATEARPEGSPRYGFPPSRTMER